MQTLDEFNEERRLLHAAFRKQQFGNGIACPKCGAELLDSDSNVTLTTDPPQKSVKCPKCGYGGYRLT